MNLLKESEAKTEKILIFLGKYFLAALYLFNCLKLSFSFPFFIVSPNFNWEVYLVGSKKYTDNRNTITVQVYSTSRFVPLLKNNEIIITITDFP
jgi:hypothetical protein